MVGVVRFRGRAGDVRRRASSSSITSALLPPEVNRRRRTLSSAAARTIVRGEAVFDDPLIARERPGASYGAVNSVWTELNGLTALEPGTSSHRLRLGVRDPLAARGELCRRAATVNSPTSQRAPERSGMRRRSKQSLDLRPNIAPGRRMRRPMTRASKGRRRRRLEVLASTDAPSAFCGRICGRVTMRWHACT